MMQSIAAVFPVQDVQKTTEWYGRVLGFEAKRWPAENPCFAILTRGAVEIMVRQDPAVMLKHGRATRWNAYIRMKGVEALFTGVKEQAKVLRALEKAPYGDTEFEIEDCNGYVICFSELL